MMDPIDMSERNRAHQEGDETAFEILCEKALEDDAVALKAFGRENVVDMMADEYSDICRWMCHICGRFSEMPQFDNLNREVKTYTAGAMANWEELIHGNDPIALAFDVVTKDYGDERRAIERYSCGKAFLILADSLMDLAVDLVRENWNERAQGALELMVTAGE